MLRAGGIVFHPHSPPSSVAPVAAPDRKDPGLICHTNDLLDEGMGVTLPENSSQSGSIVVVMYISPFGGFALSSPKRWSRHTQTEEEGWLVTASFRMASASRKSCSLRALRRSRMPLVFPIISAFFLQRFPV